MWCTWEDWAFDLGKFHFLETHIMHLVMLYVENLCEIIKQIISEWPSKNVSLCDSIQILLQYMQIQIQIQIQNIITICYYNICKSNSFFKSWLLRSQPGLLALWRQKENIFCTNMLLSLLFSSQICFREKLFFAQICFCG